MAVVRNKTDYLRRIKEALVSELKTRGIDAKVDTQKVPTTKLHRVWVLAPKFGKLKHTERQDLDWRIADTVLTPEEQLNISMILTLTPDEAGFKEQHRGSGS